MASTRTVLVDDTSPLIQYGPSWFFDDSGSQDTPVGNLGPVFNKTLHGTTTSTSFTFEYNGRGVNVVGTNHPSVAEDGVSISWFGYIPTEKPHVSASATFSIDNTPPITFTLVALAPGSTEDVSTLYNQELFTTPALPFGPHTLDVVFLGDDKTTSLVLDYLVIQGGAPSHSGVGPDPAILPTPGPDSALPQNQTSNSTISLGQMGSTTTVLPDPSHGTSQLNSSTSTSTNDFTPNSGNLHLYFSSLTSAIGFQKFELSWLWLSGINPLKARPRTSTMSLIPRSILVDDTSPLIQYEGTWFADASGLLDNTGIDGTTFNQTLHWTTENGTITFPYTGTIVNVVGSTRVRNDTGIPDPEWECSVDGVPMPNNIITMEENNWNLCTSSGTPEGDHVLTVKITIRQAQTYYLDRIIYSPSSSVPVDDKTLIINNNDPALQYGPGWGPASIKGQHATTISGSKVTLDFIGVSLGWFAAIDRTRSPAHATYSIDQGTPTNFVIGSGGVGPNATTLFTQRLFMTPDLAPGPHHLEVVFLGSEQTTNLMLDFLVVQNSTTPIGPIGQATQATTPSSHLGSIIGGALGGLIVVLGGFLVFYWRSRQKRKQPIISEFEIQTSFVSAGSSSNATSRFLPPSKLARQNQPPTQFAPSHSPMSSNPSSAAMAHPNTTQLPLTEQNDPTESEGVIMHYDSGIRNVMSIPPQKVEVPPLYTET
ncbi:hypothetical protein CVT24_011166 [Panaeolus cyanescens]|uniref:Transmembrane protein n=1 Tax=Panaeolus cyanescens TaxID=181874 RepID=A0A409YGB7_9AGAR|nr:hypothetical protein CVT24_011166 [Panaeolus cyanescens]